MVGVRERTKNRMRRRGERVNLETIKARCIECGDCWVWASTLLRGQHPIMKSKGKSFYPKRVAWELHHGKKIPEGHCVVNKVHCANPHCCNPEHTHHLSRRRVLQMTVATGKMHTPLIKAKIAAAKRRESKLSDEAVLEFTHSDESVPVLAARHGISEAYGYMIRRGEFRKPLSSPFAGLA